jgi:D-arabinose 1-dehydrogenase-like Zn-dependent alcohol dehydrogenase
MRIEDFIPPPKTTKEAEVARLTEIVVGTGMHAAEAALRTLTDVIEQEVSDDKERLAATAGALAHLRWKVSETIKQIKRIDPKLVALIEGIEQATNDAFAATFTKFAEETAKDHGLELGQPN